jgi:hypothetical protein
MLNCGLAEAFPDEPSGGKGGVGMKICRVLFTAVVAALFFSGGTCLAEELSRDNKALENQAIADSGIKEVQWLWGEVVLVDAAKKQVIVRYLDYETDNEKEISLSVDGKTAYENIKDISELKAQDIVSVDYVSDAGGNNAAVNISVEKLEDAQNSPEEELKEPPSASGAQSGD